MFEKFRKLGNKGIYLSIAFIIILFAIIWGILSINTGEKTPVDSQRVYEEIINLGYEPIDTTSLYIEDDSNLQKSVTIDNKKIRFDFFEFDNDNSAINVYNHACSQMHTYQSGDMIERDEGYNNYSMYSLKSKGVYYITIRVGNTALYAYCDEEYKSELDTILLSIDYGSSTKNK